MCKRASLVPRPSIIANAVEGLVKLLCRMTSGGRWEAMKEKKPDSLPLTAHTKKKKRSWIQGWSSSCVKKPTSAKAFQMSIKCLLLCFLKWFSIEHGKHSQEALFLVRFREFNSGHTLGSHVSCDPWTMLVDVTDHTSRTMATYQVRISSYPGSHREPGYDAYQNFFLCKYCSWFLAHNN